jgi:hypothetical protein
MNLKDCLPHRKVMFPWLADLPNLSPDSFPWNEWEGDNSWLGWGDKDIIELPEGWIALGWCDGGKLAVRPKPDQIAVKFNDGERDFWQHILV